MHARPAVFVHEHCGTGAEASRRCEHTCLDLPALLRLSVAYGDAALGVAEMQGRLPQGYGFRWEPELSKGDMRSMKRSQRLYMEYYDVAAMRSMTRHHWTPCGG